MLPLLLVAGLSTVTSTWHMCKLCNGAAHLLGGKLGHLPWICMVCNLHISGNFRLACTLYMIASACVMPRRGVERGGTACGSSSQ